MFQWRQATNVRTTEGVCGGEIYTSYTYNLGWSEQVQESGSFHDTGYENPELLPIKPELQVAESASLGQFKLSQSQVERLGRFQKVELTDWLFKDIVKVIRKKQEFK